MTASIVGAIVVFVDAALHVGDVVMAEETEEAVVVDMGIDDVGFVDGMNAGRNIVPELMVAQVVLADY